MSESTLFEAFATYGIGGIVAGVLLFILYKIVMSGIKGLQKSNANYMEIINRQNTTQNNHIHHLDESIKAQAAALVGHGERFSAGVEKICDAIEAQTDILKEHIQSNSRRK